MWARRFPMPGHGPRSFGAPAAAEPAARAHRDLGSRFAQLPVARRPHQQLRGTGHPPDRPERETLYPFRLRHGHAPAEAREDRAESEPDAFGRAAGRTAQPPELRLRIRLPVLRCRIHDLQGRNQFPGRNRDQVAASAPKDAVNLGLLGRWTLTGRASTARRPKPGKR